MPCSHCSPCSFTERCSKMCARDTWLDQAWGQFSHTHRGRDASSSRRRCCTITGPANIRNMTEENVWRTAGKIPKGRIDSQLVIWKKNPSYKNNATVKPNGALTSKRQALVSTQHEPRPSVFYVDAEPLTNHFNPNFDDDSSNLVRKFVQEFSQNYLPTNWMAQPESKPDIICFKEPHEKFR